MAPNHFLQDPVPEYSERQLLHAALTELGCSVEDLISRIQVRVAPTIDVTPSAVSGTGKYLDVDATNTTTTTSTQSLSGNDASAYQTDDNDSLDDLLINDTTPCQDDTRGDAGAEYENRTKSWSADQATTGSDNLNAYDADGRTESWIPIIHDLVAPALASRDDHSGASGADRTGVRSITSQASQSWPTITLQPPVNDYELHQCFTYQSPIHSQPTAELSLVGVGGLHQEYASSQELPSRLETPPISQEVAYFNRRPRAALNVSLHGSPVDDDDFLRASQDNVCIRPPWYADESLKVSHKKPRLDNHPETTAWSASPVTPTLDVDTQASSTPPASTRSNKACLRCRFQHLGCVPDPSNPNGPCLKCKELKRSASLAQKCWPVILAEAHLYREQHCPNPFHTLRWTSMSMKNIDTWASDEIKVIQVGHVAMNKFYSLKVRKYIPEAGDMVREKWVTNRVTTYHDIPSYAIADMDEAAKMFEGYVAENADAYIEAFVGEQNRLFYHTYKMACKHQYTAPTQEERRLMKNLLQLWVCCRKTSNPERIVGDERLGVQNAYDSNSPWYNTSPIPPMMIAQMQCIFYTKFLRPLRKQVLDGLWNVLRKPRKSWLTVYLTIFILSHSCSQITRRNQEFARASGLACRFVNPGAIVDHQEGCNILLSHFHYINRGVSPFHQDTNSQTFKNFVEEASLNEEQAELIALTALWVQQNENSITQLRDNLLFEHDLYWVSQLYDRDWTRGPTVSTG